jgi:hypothetical protein
MLGVAFQMRMQLLPLIYAVIFITVGILVSWLIIKSMTVLLIFFGFLVLLIGIITREVTTPSL